MSETKNVQDAVHEPGQSGKSGKKYAGKTVLLILLAAAIGAYFVWPPYKSIIDSIFAAFATGDFAAVRSFVERYGTMAATVSFLLMVFQSIVAPLPAFLITFANANLFGWWRGAILSWSSAMAGAAVCFYIARILGRDVVEKLSSKTGLRSIDAFFERHGTQSILIARLISEFAAAADPMPAIPAMSAVWQPLGLAQANIVKGADPEQTMRSAGEEIKRNIG